MFWFKYVNHITPLNVFILHAGITPQYRYIGRDQSLHIQTFRSTVLNCQMYIYIMVFNQLVMKYTYPLYSLSFSMDTKFHAQSQIGVNKSRISSACESTVQRTNFPLHLHTYHSYYNTTQHNTTQHNTTQHNTTIYSLYTVSIIIHWQTG